MAIIKRKRGKVTYLCEAIYAGIKNGKQRYKEKVIGHYDEAGNFIPSKRMRGKKIDKFPAEVQQVTIITKKLRVK